MGVQTCYDVLNHGNTSTQRLTQVPSLTDKQAAH